MSLNEKFTKRDAWACTCMSMLFVLVVWLFLFFSGIISKNVAIVLEILTFAAYIWTGMKALTWETPKVTETVPRCFGTKEVTNYQSRAENCCFDCPVEERCAKTFHSK